MIHLDEPNEREQRIASEQEIKRQISYCNTAIRHLQAGPCSIEIRPLAFWESHVPDMESLRMKTVLLLEEVKRAFEAKLEASNEQG